MKSIIYALVVWLMLVTLAASAMEDDMAYTDYATPGRACQGEAPDG